jgi:hypothetical protein
MANNAVGLAAPIQQMRLIMADDQPDARQTLAGILREGFNLVGHQLWLLASATHESAIALRAAAVSAELDREGAKSEFHRRLHHAHQNQLAQWMGIDPPAPQRPEDRELADAFDRRATQKEAQAKFESPWAGPRPSAFRR